MNFKTAKMMTKYRVCMTFMSILLLLFHFVFLFSCGKLPEKTFMRENSIFTVKVVKTAADLLFGKKINSMALQYQLKMLENFLQKVVLK